MRFCFFTSGGKKYWEDVFYYQKWRIQRHWRTKKYRLLDNFDICRASGSFEECRKAFVKFIEVFEIPRQKGKLIILLHGLNENKKTFKPLWRALTQKGYNVAAVNYPSTKKTIRGHLDQFDFFLTHIEDIDEVSFITKGSGCLVLRCLLNESFAFEDKFKIGKVINVNPLNRGSEICEILSRFKIFRWIFGPSLSEMTPDVAPHFPRLPLNIPLGLIFCETYFDKLIKPIKKKYGGIEIPTDLSEKSFSEHIINIKNKDLNIFDNPQIVENCVRFLENGKF